MVFVLVVGGWVDISSSAAGTVLMLSVPIHRTGAAAGAEPAAYDQDEDHDPSAWGTL